MCFPCVKSGPTPQCDKLDHMDPNRHPPLIVIVGETASGKTELAIRLAKHFDGENICADSWTVRREADIGTAKPTTEEQAVVPHHLLNVVGPDEDFTAAVFKRLANEAIDDISRRGKLPVIVGGTGLYVDGVIYDFGFLPPGDRQAREALNNLSLEALLTKIKAAGIELGDVDTRNKRRLIRLIETAGAVPARHGLRANTLIIGLRMKPDLLKERISRRVDGMLAAGLEAEVRGLAARYGWDCEALKGISYVQWRDYFLGDQNLAETRQKIIKATVDLAKRQRTWLKRNKSIRWFPSPVNWPDIVDSVTTFLDR
jgi:tRNA dimethylallyltransferase